MYANKWDSVEERDKALKKIDKIPKLSQEEIENLAMVFFPYWPHCCYEEYT